jgi:hypothetical protein
MALSSATTAVRRGLFAALLWLPMLSQGADRAAAQRYYAGVQAPEDIAVLTPGKELLLAQMRAFGETRAGGLVGIGEIDRPDRPRLGHVPHREFGGEVHADNVVGVDEPGERASQEPSRLPAAGD